MEAALAAAAPQRESHSDPLVKDSNNKEQTCRADLKGSEKKQEDGGGGGGTPPGTIRPEDKNQDSPEVFENNAQAISLHPVNVTQIFVDSVVPQTNMSRNHTDIVDQNTMEFADMNMEEAIYDRLDSNEENCFPERPQKRPPAPIFHPEDSTVANTVSERRMHDSRPSEKRCTRRAGDHRPSTPDRQLPAFTPPPPTQRSEKVHTTARRTSTRRTTRAGAGPGAGVSTRTANPVSRPRPHPSAGTPPQVADNAVENTAPSHEPITTTQRAHRPHPQQSTRQQTTTDYRTVCQTAMPLDPSGATGSRESVVDNTTTAKKMAAVSNMFTAQANVKDP